MMMMMMMMMKMLTPDGPAVIDAKAKYWSKIAILPQGASV